MPLNGAGGYLATAFPNAKPAGRGRNILVIGVDQDLRDCEARYDQK
jgi:hypothetical protein